MFGSQPSGYPLISHYEEVSFRGMLGLILAVMQQPVIVNIEAKGWEFQTYSVVSLFLGVFLSVN
jgi:hypothetical protein